MTPIALAAIFAAFAWWIGTGVLFAAGALNAAGRKLSFIAATLGLCASVYGAVVTAGAASVPNAYLAFCCGLGAWAWNEAAFVMGLALGPRRAPCPPGARGWRRFTLALETMIHHELLIVATGALLLVLTWGAPNQVAPATFALLWLMRVSAKLNLFLGVPNFSDALFPERLRHLKSYFGAPTINAAFPISLIGASVIALAAFLTAAHPQASTFQETAFALLGAIAALAAVEHAFLVIPWRDDVLWRWMLGARAPAAPLEPAAADFSNREFGCATSAGEQANERAFQGAPNPRRQG